MDTGREAAFKRGESWWAFAGLGGIITLGAMAIYLVLGSAALPFLVIITAFYLFSNYSDLQILALLKMSGARVVGAESGVSGVVGLAARGAGLFRAPLLLFVPS